MPHDAEARRQASAVPLVLFGEHGRTVEGYMPAEEDLAGARAGCLIGGLRASRHEWEPVTGPHLRVVRSRDRRSKTGIVGISISRRKSTGRHHLIVNLGSTCRRFCIETLGASEAWRRAIALRRAHVEKLVQANAAILAARLRASEQATG